MTTYLVHLNLHDLRERLSQTLSCACSLADARGVLRGAGFVESSLGWLTHDLRPLMILFHRPRPGRV